MPFECPKTAADLFPSQTKGVSFFIEEVKIGVQSHANSYFFTCLASICNIPELRKHLLTMIHVDDSQNVSIEFPHSDLTTLINEKNKASIEGKTELIIKKQKNAGIKITIPNNVIEKIIKEEMGVTTNALIVKLLEYVLPCFLEATSPNAIEKNDVYASYQKAKIANKYDFISKIFGLKTEVYNSSDMDSLIKGIDKLEDHNFQLDFFMIKLPREPNSPGSESLLPVRQIKKKYISYKDETGQIKRTEELELEKMQLVFFSPKGLDYKKKMLELCSIEKEEEIKKELKEILDIFKNEVKEKKFPAYSFDEFEDFYIFNKKIKQEIALYTSLVEKLKDDETKKLKDKIKKIRKLSWRRKLKFTKKLINLFETDIKSEQVVSLLYKTQLRYHLLQGCIQDLLIECQSEEILDELEEKKKKLLGLKEGLTEIYNNFSKRVEDRLRSHPSEIGLISDFSDILSFFRIACETRPTAFKSISYEFKNQKKFLNSLIFDSGVSKEQCPQLLIPFKSIASILLENQEIPYIDKLIAQGLLGEVIKLPDSNKKLNLCKDIVYRSKTPSDKDWSQEQKLFEALLKYIISKDGYFLGQIPKKYWSSELIKSALESSFRAIEFIEPSDISDLSLDNVYLQKKNEWINDINFKKLEEPLTQSNKIRGLNTSVYPQINLFNYPQGTKEKVGHRIAIGDLHGNPVKLLYFLIENKVIKLKEERYVQFFYAYRKQYQLLKRSRKGGDEQLLVQSMLMENINLINKIIEEIEPGENFNTLVEIIGDDFSDRGVNDYITAKIYQKLDRCNIPYEVLLSNHGMDFLRAHQYKISSGKFQMDEPTLGDEQQAASLNNLIHLTKTDIISDNELSNIIENHYKPKLKLFSYSLSQEIPAKHITIFTHAVTGIETLKLLADLFNVPFDNHSAVALGHSIDLINEAVFSFLYTNKKGFEKPKVLLDDWEDFKDFEKFRQQSFKDEKEEFERFYPWVEYLNEEKIKLKEDDIKLNAIYAAVWSRDKHHKIGRPNRQGEENSPNGYSIAYCHGHDQYDPNQSHIHNLDGPVGRIEKEQFLDIGEYKKINSGQISKLQYYDLVINHFGTKDKSFSELDKTLKKDKVFLKRLLTTPEMKEKKIKSCLQEIPEAFTVLPLTHKHYWSLAKWAVEASPKVILNIAPEAFEASVYSNYTQLFQEVFLGKAVNDSHYRQELITNLKKIDPGNIILNQLKNDVNFISSLRQNVKDSLFTDKSSHKIKSNTPEKSSEPGDKTLIKTVDEAKEESTDAPIQKNNNKDNKSIDKDKPKPELREEKPNSPKPERPAPKAEEKTQPEPKTDQSRINAKTDHNRQVNEVQDELAKFEFIVPKNQKERKTYYHATCKQLDEIARRVDDEATKELLQTRKKRLHEACFPPKAANSIFSSSSPTITIEDYYDSLAVFVKQFQPLSTTWKRDTSSPLAKQVQTNLFDLTESLQKLIEEKEEFIKGEKWQQTTTLLKDYQFKFNDSVQKLNHLPEKKSLLEFVKSILKFLSWCLSFGFFDRKTNYMKEADFKRVAKEHLISIEEKLSRLTSASLAMKESVSPLK